MDPADVLPIFDPLDALEKNIEDTPIPQDLPFQDPLCQMLDKLERNIEASEVKPPLVPEERGVLENPSQGYLQQQSQGAYSEHGSAALPPLPYYLEDPGQVAQLHTPQRHPADGRIGRRGGASIGRSRTEQSDKKYCPIEDDYVSQDFCEDKDCKYYVKDSDSETGWRCTYYDE